MMGNATLQSFTVLPTQLIGVVLNSAARATTATVVATVMCVPYRADARGVGPRTSHAPCTFLAPRESCANPPSPKMPCLRIRPMLRGPKRGGGG